MKDLKSLHIHIDGIVQGVGFRPFVHTLATRLRLNGWVRNTSQGVDITVEGQEDTLEAFLRALREEAPPLAHIDALQVESAPLHGYTRFEIAPSHPLPNAFQPVSPDVSICPDCLRELFDPADRRYRYPFINCTNCGPRFTIIRDIPYDRPYTTMAPFRMCAACAQEYHDPADRRFHAQPVACPECGPHIWLEPGEAHGEAALQAARRILAEGGIVAIKGLGGFHLACDASNPAAVATLRRRKGRADKPFAVMMADLETAQRYCVLGQAARELLTSPEHPIVILEQHPKAPIAPQVAPGQNTLGVMLPYTPLHYLLLEPGENMPDTLVMTSGNLSEEPLVCDNEEARKRLASLADAFLMHNRAIHVRCDDSVVRVFQGHPYPIRRARGYAPRPLTLPHKSPPLLATGSELKNTFCLTNGHYAFPSQHIGDMGNYETLRAFEQAVMHMEHLFRVRPQALACDMHPDYLSTRYAQQRAAKESLPLVQVQHHHAHIAACMAEHQLDDAEPVIGVSFDGTGYGTDGHIWGGEFLLSTYRDFERLYHLDYIPLAGGDLAVRNPWRLALAWLERAEIPWTQDLPPVHYALEQQRLQPHLLEGLQKQLESGLNAPLTSSMGRLFDAVASLTGVRHAITYEGQAAIELEAGVADSQFGIYPMLITGQVIDPVLMVRRIVDDLRDGVPQPVIAARFHNSIAMMVHEVCRRIREKHGARRVALSGGVWQNVTLLGRVVETLRHDDFEVFIHRRIPPNDGGLAVGQAVIAIHRLRA